MSKAKDDFRRVIVVDLYMAQPSSTREHERRRNVILLFLKQKKQTKGLLWAITSLVQWYLNKNNIWKSGIITSYVWFQENTEKYIYILKKLFFYVFYII